MRDLELLPGWTIPAQDLRIRAVRSGGPGGQNVNKLATKVEVRFDFGRGAVLSEAQAARLRERFPSQVTNDGEFIVTSEVTRSQDQNREDALAKLRSMVLSIRLPPRPRIRTKPSRAQKRRRLEQKRQRAQVKKLREKPTSER